MMAKPDLFDTAHIRDEPEHWDALAQRIMTSAVRASKRGAVSWLGSSRTAWVVVCLFVAAALVIVMLPADRAARVTQRSQWAEMVAPSDEVGQAIVVRESPPAVGALLLKRTR